MEGWTEEEIKNRVTIPVINVKIGPARRSKIFPLATGLRIIKRAIPVWREKVAAQGDEKGSREWARKECECCRMPV